MLITSFYCVAGKQYFYAKIYSQKRATLAMQQDDGTARQQDCETTGLRDHGTTKKKHRHSQAFPVVRSCARQLGVRRAPSATLGKNAVDG